MFNLVRANFYQLAHTRGGWALPAGLVLLMIAEPFVLMGPWAPCETFRDVLARLSLAEFSCVFGALWLANFFALDIKERTVRHLLVAPSSRRAFVGAALVTTLLCSLALVFAGMVAGAAAFSLAGGGPITFDGPELIAWWLMAALLVTAFAMISTLAALAFNGAASTVAIIVATLFSTGCLYWFASAATASLPEGIGQLIFDYVMPLTLSQTRLRLTLGASIEAWWFIDAATIIAVATAAAGLVLRRKELR